MSRKIWLEVGVRRISLPPPAIDIEKLTEKVYQLMREEIRLARARGNKRSTRR